MDGMNYYRLFALRSTATLLDIKRRYRELSFQHHPDHGGNPEKMAQINEAYRVLSNGLLRREYDQRYAAWQAAAQPYADVARPAPTSVNTTPTQPTEPMRSTAPTTPHTEIPLPKRPLFWTWAVGATIFAVGFLGYQLFSLFWPSHIDAPAATRRITSFTQSSPGNYDITPPSSVPTHQSYNAASLAHPTYTITPTPAPAPPTTSLPPAQSHNDTLRSPHSFEQ